MSVAALKTCSQTNSTRDAGSILRWSVKCSGTGSDYGMSEYGSQTVCTAVSSIIHICMLFSISP